MAHFVDHSVFDVITDDSAYWAGFIMADGWVVRNGHGVSVSIKASDIGHLQKLKDFLKTTAPIYVRKNSPSSFGKFPGHNATLSVTSKKIASALGLFGITPRKSLTAKVSILENHPRFWAGMIDGDGHLTFEWTGAPVIGLSSASKVIVEQFLAFSKTQFTGSKAGVVTIKRPPPWKTMYRVSFSTSYALAMAKIIYQDGLTSLDRKHAIAKQFQAHVSARVTKKSLEVACKRPPGHS